MKQNFIHSYRQSFEQSFNVPDMLNDIKSELTFTPHIMFKKRVMMRLLLELMASFALVYNAYSIAYGMIDYEVGATIDHNKVTILLSIAGILFMLCMYEIVFRIIQIKKNRA